MGNTLLYVFSNDKKRQIQRLPQSVDKTTLVDETEGRFFVFIDNFE